MNRPGSHRFSRQPAFATSSDRVVDALVVLVAAMAQSIQLTPRASER